jgi:hypothetical protein
MTAPTPTELAAAKAAARDRFGTDRLVGVTFNDPQTGDETLVLLADVTLASLGEIFDSNFAPGSVLSRRVWPSDDDLEIVRAQWPAFDTRVESAFLSEAGLCLEEVDAHQLSVATAPRGLEPKALAELLAANKGLRLWSVVCEDNGLACVLRNPTPEIWSMTKTQISEAMRAGKGTLAPALNTIVDHCVWSPNGPGEGLRAHINERPGRARNLLAPWAHIGGAGAKTSARRF